MKEGVHCSSEGGGTVGTRSLGAQRKASALSLARARICSADQGENGQAQADARVAEP